MKFARRRANTWPERSSSVPNYPGPLLYLDVSHWVEHHRAHTLYRVKRCTSANTTLLALFAAIWLEMKNDWRDIEAPMPTSACSLATGFQLVALL